MSMLFVLPLVRTMFSDVSLRMPHRWLPCRNIYPVERQGEAHAVLVKVHREQVIVCIACLGIGIIAATASFQ